MKRRSFDSYVARAKIAKALAHPSRLLMLDALRQRELCVGDLTELAGADQSTVSKHLAILKDTGFLSVRRQGAMSYYSVKCQCLDAFFDCLESVLRQNLEEQKALVSIRGA